MEEQGVQVVAPNVIGQHLDIPAITPQILGAFQQTEKLVVVDVGGDPQGARALGQYSGAIRQAAAEGRPYTMHFVVNPYRPFTDTLEGLAHSIAEIEATSRLKVSSLVSNPNLIGETTVQTILDQLMPGLVPLLMTFACMALLKRKVNAIWIIFGLFAVGIVGYGLGILNVK